MYKRSKRNYWYVEEPLCLLYFINYYYQDRPCLNSRMNVRDFLSKEVVKFVKRNTNCKCILEVYPSIVILKNERFITQYNNYIMLYIYIWQYVPTCLLHGCINTFSSKRILFYLSVERNIVDNGSRNSWEWWYLAI